MNQILRRWGMPALACAVLLACASTPPPDALRSEAEAALRNAVAKDADEHAPIELRFARERIDGARVALEERNHARAARLYEQSIVNSELAVAKTAAAKAREEVRRQDAANRALREELGEEGES